MNFLAKGLHFLFSSSMSSSSNNNSEAEEQHSQSPLDEEEVECSGSALPAVEAKQEEEEKQSPLEMEEETPAFIAAVNEAAKEKKKSSKKSSKRERDSVPAPPPSEEEEKEEEEESDGPEIDLPKATERIKRSTKATFTVNKVDPRVRKLVVSVPKGNRRTKEYTYPYIDFPDDEIITKLKAVMEKDELDYMNAFQAAMFAPGLFWNAIYHWKNISVFEEKLLEAGVPNGQRRTRQKK